MGSGLALSPLCPPNGGASRSFPEEESLLHKAV
nr:MAG TPA_asm: hypothetical protein [Caudoviricetes sp.]